ncbi:MAG TPA: PP2C family protein-serine/threonine phosphatase [Acidimicrobiales bacterium]|nr:PP2C family protein-serine/threonine phosphatase [Acidimicrobiales bacterium]
MSEGGSEVASATRPVPRFSAATAAAVVAMAGLIVTGVASWTARTLDRQNEKRLLAVQAKQAASVIASAVLGIENPLQTALQVERVTDGDPARFISFMSSYVGPGKLFVSATLWGPAGPSATTGAPAELSPTSPEALALVDRARRSTTFVVAGIPGGILNRIGYAIGDPTDARFVVYAERAIPADRRVPVESDAAFADIHFATYLGATTNAAYLATTDVAPSQLPLTGQTARESIAFGDSTLTLVASPRGPLGGRLAGDLPWIFLAAGLVLTAATTVLAEELVRRRRRAERDAATISALYAQLDASYGEQRTISETLQRALLPQGNPAMANLETASCYVAGAEGVDIGGDWYSLVPIDDRRFGFVVGDVSGRGVEAAAIMARLRFTIRAYLLEGHLPDAVLEMCSRQVDITGDGHFATVLVGVGDVVTGRITIANAGHLNPLVLTPDGSHIVETPVGPPLGTITTPYAAASFQLAPGSTLFAFTDGLVERRHEDIERGLARLADAAAAPAATLEARVTRVVDALTPRGAEDDLAVLAFTWSGDGAVPAPSAELSGEAR